MPIFYLRIHLGLLNVHKIENAQKLYNSHVIKFIVLNLMVKQIKPK
jgi:hypothetical protein